MHRGSGGIVKTSCHSVFLLTSTIPNFMAAGCISLLLASAASIKAGPQGFMERHSFDAGHRKRRRWPRTAGFIFGHYGNELVSNPQASVTDFGQNLQK